MEQINSRQTSHTYKMFFHTLLFHTLLFYLLKISKILLKTVALLTSLSSSFNNL